MYEQEEKFGVDVEDEDIITTVAQWFKESEPYHDEMLRKQKISERYYNGEQTDADQIPPYLSNTTQNRIFEATETVVPIATANAHHFLVLPGTDAELSVQRADKLSKVLERKYQTLGMQKMLEDIVRHMLIFRFGVMKWYWNEEKDDVGICTVDPRLIYVPKLRLDPHDLPYKIELQEYTSWEIKNYFPGIKLDELEFTDTKYDIDNRGASPKKTYKVKEVWTHEVVAWVSGNTVLNKLANPYWDWSGKLDKNGINKKNNFLDTPQDPLVFFSLFNVSDGPLPNTCIVEQAIPLQDDINTRKRRIIDNLNLVGNGQVYVDSDALMSKEQSDNITNEPGLVIVGEGVASQNKIRREPGVPLPQAHFADLQATQAAFDNLFGIHGATRGASGSPTLGQDMISRQQDYTRIDLITRELNRGIRRVSNGIVQLISMFFTEQHVVKILGDDGAIEFIKLNNEEIEKNIEIEVKDGAVIQMDEVSLHNEAIQLWQLGAIDPESLYQRLKDPNPEKRAQKLMAFKQGQLLLESQIRMKENAAATEAGAVAKAQNPPEKSGEGRGVETPMNVIQRAQQLLGGAAMLSAGQDNRTK